MTKPLITSSAEPTTSKPRVLLVTRNLPPLRGGMERLNLHLAQALSDWGELTVIGPEGCGTYLPKKVSVIEVPIRPLWRFLLASFREARYQAKIHKFDISIAGSGLTTPAALQAAHCSGGKSAAYVHGLDLLAGHPIYRTFWRPALRRLDLAVANSGNTADIARRLGVARRHIEIVHPGVMLPDQAIEKDNDFRGRHGLGDRPLLLSVGRLTARKGLVEFVRHSLPLIVESYPETVLVVIGDEAPDALTGTLSGGKAAVVSVADELGLSDNLQFLGPCDDIELSRAYFAADVHVFPVREVPGDVEGFGMVAVEAAAHGLPTVAFAVGGIPDAVAQGISGWLVSPGNLTAFTARTTELLCVAREKPLRLKAKEFAAAFEWGNFSDQTRMVLTRALLVQSPVPPARHGHAVLNLQSRESKAKKIEHLLKLTPQQRPLRLLEVGTGSGGIAHYFGSHPTLKCNVDSVDIGDTRQIREGYRFHQVEDVTIPFPDANFDVVLSNHVVEHVGDRNAQLLHLKELRRVLKVGGIGYLAVPNRWQWIEPHYQLAGLSWLPESLRSPYLRWRQRGNYYDCRPLTRHGTERLLAQAGFEAQQQHGQALRLTYELERPNALIYKAFFKHLPNSAFAIFKHIIPTLIYVLRPIPDRSAD